MKRFIALILTLICVLSLLSCASEVPEVINTIDGNMRTYHELSNGTWECNEHIYKYRLEIKGTMPNAAKKSTFVYLSNIESISFDRAWKAAGLSSNMNDYFDINEAVLVELRSE